MQACISSRPRLSRCVTNALTTLILIATALAAATTASCQAPVDQAGPLQSNSDVARRPPFDNDAVVRMTKAGLDESLILDTIQARPSQFDVSPDGLIALKEAGVSAAVMKAMQAKSSGLSGTTRRELGTLKRNDVAGEKTTPGLVPGAKAQMLDELGVYYKDRHGDWVPLKTEKAIEKSGGFVKSTLTHNIIKEDVNGFVYGPRSPLHLAGEVEILIYAPSGVDATEYDFIRFRPKSTGREFRVRTGGVIHSKTGAERDEVEFDPKRIAPQMYTFTVPADILKGEYGVLPPGISVNKVYTFSIVE